MDAGAIVSIKKRYRRKQIDRAVDLLDSSITEDLYKTNLLVAIRTIYEIWYELDRSIIYNCLLKTG